MEWSTYKDLISEIAPFACAIKLSFIGEPLMHPRLMDMIKLAKSRTDAYVYLFSNGSLLDLRLMAELMESGLDAIVFSIDAYSDDTFRQIRRNSIPSDIQNNIETFANLIGKARRPAIKINCLELPLNADERLRLKQHWESLGIPVGFSPLIKWNNSVDSQNVESLSMHHATGHRTPCAELWYKATIRYNGTVVQCCNDFLNRAPIGYLDAQSFQDIWNSHKFKRLRERHIAGDFSPCALCGQCTTWRMETEFEQLINSRTPRSIVQRP